MQLVCSDNRRPDRNSSGATVKGRRRYQGRPPRNERDEFQQTALIKAFAPDFPQATAHGDDADERPLVRDREAWLLAPALSVLMIALCSHTCIPKARALMLKILLSKYKDCSNLTNGAGACHSLPTTYAMPLEKPSSCPVDVSQCELAEA